MTTLSQSAQREEQARAVELLREHQRFLLVGHALPDGDCLGAQAALAGVLQALGKDCWILNPDPVQPEFGFLEGLRGSRVYRGGALPAHDLAVLLDFCELERCGPLAAPLAATRTPKLVVDHHVFVGAPWWDAAYRDRGASATGLLVRRIARDLGVTLDVAAAHGVFTSLVTDTGWFRYSNTDSETLAVAAEMVDLGVSPQVVYAAVFQRAGRDRPLAIARALSRTSYHDSGRVAMVDLPAAGQGEPVLDDGDEVLDLLRAVATVEVVLLLRETSAGAIRLSVRSKSDFDASALARELGGGGHLRAAGATLGGPLEQARERVLGATLRRLQHAGGRRR